MPLLVPAGASGDPQGVLRVLNGTAESGVVEIYAFDDAGTRSGPATFTLVASAAVQFTSTDLEAGNTSLGLTGGIGAEVGDARLEIETELQIVPLAYVRAADGTLSAMHDTVRAASTTQSDQYRYDVPIFNPSTEMTQTSRLRLINPGAAAAAITITGRDDNAAEATGGDVSLTLAAGGAKTLTAQQLEAGDMDVTGQLGAGTGTWRLMVSSDQPLHVVNIVIANSGYWNNLSTTALPGAAPADQAALNERFVGESVFSETSNGQFTFNAMEGERFTETGESDGVTTTYMGSYNYSAIGPDAGRLTLDYDAGKECLARFYFSSRRGGWFVSHCTSTDDPEGYLLGGNWSLDEDAADSGEVVGTTYGVDDTLPGVPTSGQFAPAALSDGSFTSNADGTTISLNDGGYFDLDDGTRFICTAPDGCGVENGSVTRGTVAGRPADSGEVDRFPSFRTVDRPGNQGYTVETTISTLTLPQASGGNGTLSYSLSPSVPGLSFDPSTRQLTGTPSTAGAYSMAYTVTDEDGDTDTLNFSITVGDSGDGSNAPEGFDLYADDRNADPVRVAYANDRFYVVDDTDNSVYVYSANGERVEAADFDLDAANANPNGITYANGRFYVVDWIDDKVYAYSGTGEREAAGDFDLSAFVFARGIAFANNRFHVVDSIDDKVYAYSATGEREAAGDFDLDGGNSLPEGITYANDRFLVVDSIDDKVYAYSATGEREATADVDLDSGNRSPEGITYADSRFFVIDRFDEKLYAYSGSGQREAAADFDLEVDHDNANSDASGIAYANERFFVVDWVDDKVYAYSAIGEREPAADIDLDPFVFVGFGTGIVYASDRLYVVDSLDDKAYAFSVTGQRESSADFDLDDDNDNAEGITFGNDRFYVVDDGGNKVFVYSATGQREVAADFDLDGSNDRPRGIVYANDRLYAVDWFDDKAYAYTASGQREAAADFDLNDENGNPRGITYVSGRFFVVDDDENTVYTYDDETD